MYYFDIYAVVRVLMQMYAVLS